MATNDRLLVQIASYNTNLQGHHGLPQDLVDWLAPTLRVSSFLAREQRGPDIIAVGFQELLPLHLGLPGFTKAVLESREKLLLSQIEAHAPNQERYSLAAKICNVGVALLVYVRDESLARRITDVQTSWTGCGLGGIMGNKGAVGIRFRIPTEGGDIGETYTFVCAHLTPHAHKLKSRIRDWDHIVGRLLFPPTRNASASFSTLYETSHLFVFGDLNFRVVLPSDHPHYGAAKQGDFANVLERYEDRENIKEYDQLIQERRRGNVFIGLREGKFWDFKCSYKYINGEVDRYSTKRAPSWTDRIMYASHVDHPDDLESSGISNVLYTSIPSYVLSDHKPIVALLLLPKVSEGSQPLASLPSIRLPPSYAPTPFRFSALTRYFGRALDRILGFLLFAITIAGAGNAFWGLTNFFVGLGAWSWWRSRPLPGLP